MYNWYFFAFRSTELIRLSAAITSDVTSSFHYPITTNRGDPHCFIVFQATFARRGERTLHINHANFQAPQRKLMASDLTSYQHV